MPDTTPDPFSLQLEWSPQPGLTLRITYPVDTRSEDLWAVLYSHIVEYKILKDELGGTIPSAAPVVNNITPLHPAGAPAAAPPKAPRPGKHGQIVRRSFEAQPQDRYIGQWWIETVTGIEFHDGDNPYFKLSTHDGGKDDKLASKSRHVMGSMPGFPTGQAFDWLKAHAGQPLDKTVYVQFAITGEIYPENSKGKGAGNLRPVAMVISVDKKKAESPAALVELVKGLNLPTE